MYRKFLKAVSGALCILNFTMKANALSEGNIIYIQEDGPAALSQMVGEIISYIWKDVVSFAAAAGCTTLMLILAVKLKKRGK